MIGKTKIREIGNSAGLILTKEMLKKLDVNLGDELEVYSVSRGLELRVGKSTQLAPTDFKASSP